MSSDKEQGPAAENRAAKLLVEIDNELKEIRRCMSLMSRNISAVIILAAFSMLMYLVNMFVGQALRSWIAGFFVK